MNAREQRAFALSGVAIEVASSASTEVLGHQHDRAAPVGDLIEHRLAGAKPAGSEPLEARQGMRRQARSYRVQSRQLAIR